MRPRNEKENHNHSHKTATPLIVGTTETGGCLEDDGINAEEGS